MADDAGNIQVVVSVSINLCRHRNSKNEQASEQTRAIKLLPSPPPTKKKSRSKGILSHLHSLKIAKTTEPDNYLGYGDAAALLEAALR